MSIFTRGAGCDALVKFATKFAAITRSYRRLATCPVSLDLLKTRKDARANALAQWLKDAARGVLACEQARLSNPGVDTGLPSLMNGGDVRIGEFLCALNRYYVPVITY
jgi:hypothetical protein